MHSNSYILKFVLIMTVSVAVLLACMSAGLLEIHQQNEAIYNKKSILAAIKDQIGEDPKSMSSESIQNIFDTKITQLVLDMEGNNIDTLKAEDVNMRKERKKPEAERVLPLYIYENNGEKIYIASVRGNGLWDEIWGSIAIKDDFNTISGVSFDHTGETPGLGAEIKDNPTFPIQFVGDKLYTDEGVYASVNVKKGGAAPTDEHAVDGISGATITCDGVSEMMYRGMKYYEPYFMSMKTQKGQ